MICAALRDREFKQYPFHIEYSVLEREHELARSIAEYLVRSPRLPKTSLNRARFFIANGRFAPPHASSETCRPSAISTSKNAWYHYAQVSPFLVAADICRFKIVELPPDGPAAFSRVSRLKKSGRLVQYFSTAKSIQLRLLNVLTPTAEASINFIKFPRKLSIAEVVLPEFNEKQLPRQSRLGDYRCEPG